MKTYRLLFLAVLATACKQNEVKTINGTYVHQAESEYSKATDTLIVTPYDAKAGTFILIRKIGFHRIKQGKLQPKENKQQRMIGVWDEETHQLQDLKDGKIYSFPAEGNELLAGTVKYRKIQ